MGGWSVAAVATSALAGGVTGPLAGLVFLPLAAGIVLGGRVLAQTGAVAFGLATLVGLISVLLGGPCGSSPVIYLPLHSVSSLAVLPAPAGTFSSVCGPG